MADSTVEVRLVRCPKCENLLQEPKDCSFFKCGGCGTILCCAKNKGNEADSKLDTNSVTNIAKETELNSSSSDEESCSDTSLRHKTSDSGLDRFRKRTTQRSNSEGFRFSASNNIQDSVSSDDDGLVQKLDNLKEHLLLQPKEKQTKVPLRFPSSGKHAPGPSYCSYNNNHDVSLHGPMHNQPYGDPHGYHMHERTDPRYSRQYIGNNNEHDMFNTHQRNGMLVQSKCSCFHCYDPYHRASGSAFPPSGLQDALHSVGFYSHERSTGFPSSLHSPRAFTTPHPLGYVLKSSISRLHRHKDASSSGCSRLIKPVAGGAPFMRCKNCSKLLKLPDKTDSAMRKQQRLRCGACSCLIDFSFDDDKKLILSTDLALPRKAETHHSKAPWVADVNFSSDDYDNDVYKFDTMDRGTADLSTGPVLISNKAQEVQIVDSTSPSVSEDELSSDSPSGRTLIPDLPIHKHFDKSLINVRDRSESRSQSSRSEQDRVTLSKTGIRQNSMKEASVAIEMDVNDYSQDSANEYREDNGRTKKSGFASIVKNSFKDLKKSIQNDGISEVSVNGHPLAERLVRMAEKQAGPIRPGNYWYDYRAGFWGVMGGPCLGILPPFIEELNYPMHENCTGGTTSVFVNGRELHQRDLRLLTSRGLPRDKDRSYTVYITGRVIDEDTGEELDSLGKLAPTVDKLKRGFGMRVPRRAA